MIIGIPAYQNHHLTSQLLESLADTIWGDQQSVVIVDNGSPTPYRWEDLDVPDGWPFRLRLIRNERNEGNFYPLRQIADLPHEQDQDVVALLHNDMILYEQGWNLRVEAAFDDVPDLGLVGLAGTAEIDREGQRGPIESNFRGTRGHATAEGIGTRITDLRPAVVVDGLFMAFRRAALTTLTLDISLPPAHWYDYIWSAQVQLAGWRVATLGVECDHVGWQTEKGQADALQAEWRRWCNEHWIDPGTSPMDAIMAYGDFLWQSYRGRFWPCRINADWQRQAV